MRLLFIASFLLAFEPNICQNLDVVNNERFVKLSSDSSGPLDRFKLYGERNTGTRYVERLLNANLAIPPLVLRLKGEPRISNLSEVQKDKFYQQKWGRFLGWKHACAPMAAQFETYDVDTRRILFVVTGKNPYSWLLSIWRHPYHYAQDLNSQSFNSFVRRPWVTLGRENFKSCSSTLSSQEQLTGRTATTQHPRHRHPYFRDPIDLWNRKHASYTALPAPNVYRLRYEDLVSDPERALGPIYTRFNVPRKHDKFQNIDDSTKNTVKDFASYRDYYMNEKWKRQFDSRITLAFINRGLDKAVLRSWGYGQWEPSPEELRGNIDLKRGGEKSWMHVRRSALVQSRRAAAAAAREQ